MNRICITGASLSGKTTLAISLASNLLTKNKKNTCIIVNCKTTPSHYPIIFPFANEESFTPLSTLIGKNIDREIISKYILTHKSQPNIGFIGYTIKDNRYSYPNIPFKDINAIGHALSELSDNIIYDCDDEIFSSPLSLYAIQESNYHISIFNPDVRNVSYMRMTSDYISSKSKAKRINVLNNVITSKYSSKEGLNFDYEIPFIENVTIEYYRGNILGYNMNNDKRATNIISKILKETNNG